MMRTILTFIPALLFKAISFLRNLLFDGQVLSSQKFTSPFILVIGNLSVGGTGKSPLVTYIIQHWPWKSELGVLSRGYGRKTKGFQWVRPLSTAKDVGDEPLAYKKLFPTVPVAVCEKRPLGVQKMVEDFPFLDTVILDDAFQHRQISGNLNIVCTTFSKPFFEDQMMPMGRLRESISGIHRADALFVNRCPKDFNESEFAQKMRKYVPDSMPIFYTQVKYGQIVSPTAKNIKWHLLAGIADPTPFSDYVSSQFQVVSERIFPDHHAFSHDEINELNQMAQKLPDDERLLTTHKDYMRFIDSFSNSPDLKQKLHYLPIEMSFVNQEKEFWAWLAYKMKR
jgi:tetraacyldisaccharide 4'-kinase